MSKIKEQPEEEIENETFDEESEDEEDDDEDIEEIDEYRRARNDSQENISLPTNKTEKYAAAPNRQQAELELELKLRRLADLERQLKTKKISLKNDAQLTGVMSEQEMLGIAAALKYEVNTLILYMKQALHIDDKWFVDLFDEIIKGEKEYEYWLYDKK